MNIKSGLRYLLNATVTNKLSFELNSVKNNEKIFYNKNAFYISEAKKTKTISYSPIRTLKKSLTTLYITKDYLNKGEYPKKVSFFLYLFPFVGMCLNNFLSSWSIISSSCAFVLLAGGLYISRGPVILKSSQIIKFQCSNDLSKYYITVANSLMSRLISRQNPKNYQGLQQFGVFTKEDLANVEYVPTNQDRLLTQDQIKAKKTNFQQELVKKIIKQRAIQAKIIRFQLNASKTKFKLSNQPIDIITDDPNQKQIQNVNTDSMLKNEFKYLICRTQFINSKSKENINLYINLQESGDLRYQDYLIALGYNFKITQ